MTAACSDCSRIASFLKESTHKSPHSNVVVSPLPLALISLNIQHRADSTRATASSLARSPSSMNVESSEVTAGCCSQRGDSIWQQPVAKFNPRPMSPLLDLLLVDRYGTRFSGHHRLIRHHVGERQTKICACEAISVTPGELSDEDFDTPSLERLVEAASAPSTSLP